MKRTGKHWAAFFKRALAMLLVVVLLAGNLGVGGVAAQMDAGQADAAAGEAAGNAAGQAPETTETTPETTPETTEAAEASEAAPAPESQPADNVAEQTPAAVQAPESQPAAQPTDSAPGQTPQAPEAPAALPADNAPAESAGAPALAPPARAGEGTGSTAIDFTGYQNTGLTIYNYLYYTDASAAVTQGSGSYKITGNNTQQGETAGQSIVIGNAGSSEGDTRPMDQDIPVSLDGLTMSEPMTIKPVGTANANKVELTVTGTSTLGALVVEEDARLDLVLNADLTAASITLRANSVLTVTGSGTLTVTGGFTGEGTVALNGATILANAGLSAAALTLNGTTINAGGNAVTAAQTLTMQNSAVEYASLFGYDAASGQKTLTLGGSNNSFTNVAAVGCPAGSAARVSVEGIETVTASSDTTYYCDYTITYQSEDAAIDPQAGWPVAYRVSSGTNSFSAADIRGYHTDTSYTAGESVPLPMDFVQAGYLHEGWKVEGSQETITALTAAAGNLTLLAVHAPGAVTVQLDRGYTPDQYTNDAEADGSYPAKTSAMETRMDGTVQLPVLSRFGYKFTGWKITSGSNQRALAYIDGQATEYKAALGDCAAEDGKTVVKAQAQWEADKFNLTLFLGANVERDENLEISVDGGSTFVPFRELMAGTSTGGVDGTTGATKNLDFTIEGRSIKFTDRWPITYGESISAYLHKVFEALPAGSLPVLQDISAAGTAQNFAGWMSEAGTIGGTEAFCYGAGGMLAPNGQTLKEYQKALHQNNATINAVWGVMSYGLTLPSPMPAGWSLTYTGPEGSAHTINAGEAPAAPVMVQQGSTVTLTTGSVTPENFSLWGFHTDDSAKTKILPAEQAFNPGDPNLTYQFPMPAANVSATYGEGKEIWIDIAQSPILFEETVAHHNRARSGFWYAGLIDEMTPLFQSDSKTLPGTDRNGTPLTGCAYFYQWDFADKFCVTSNNIGTQNQLTLVNALTGGVYFKDARLVMRDKYRNDTDGSLLGGVDCESSTEAGEYTSAQVVNGFAAAGVNLPDYANIIINNGTRKNYNTTLVFRGQGNTVGAIMQDALRPNSDYENNLTVQGEGQSTSALRLGSAFGNFSYDIKNIQVTEYTKDSPAAGKDFKYLIYAVNQNNIRITNADIKAAGKNIHAGDLTAGGKNATIKDSKVELYSVCVFMGIRVDGSYLRIREDARFGHIPLRLFNGSRVVIDGNLEMHYHHWNDVGTITDETNNWLIVKGNRCDISNRYWVSGTLICNALILGRTGGIKGGTVITNQLLNQPVGFWKYNSITHTYDYAPEGGGNQSKPATSNGDDYPFTTWHINVAEFNTYSFSGGKIYLLGYYKAAEKKYDSTVKATESDNPVAPFINGLLDENGDLVENPSVSTAAAETAVKTSDLNTNECVVLGNSSDYYSTRRGVELSGNVELYAAGNITFYNNTTVSGGSVYCNGSFGSKGDLTVTGGSITAAAVGNACNTTTTLEDTTRRWKRTDLQGGRIDAGRIGAFEKRVSDSAVPADEAQWPRSTVTIGTAATLAGTPGIFHDVYINYIFDSGLFTNDGTPANPNNLRFETTWAGSKPFAEQAWSNTALTFTAPNVIGGTDTAGSWNWGSLYGAPVGGVSDAGIAQNGGTALTTDQKAYDRLQMKLYAVKETYTLLFKAGAGEITGITCNGAAVDKIASGTDGQVTATVKAGGNVVLKFKTDEMAADYSVLWYIDGSGIIHSVQPDRSTAGQVSFTMPNSDVEVYAAREMTLDLDKASYTLLQDGFRTEANETPQRADSTFHYLGSLVIQQGSIDKIDFRLDGEGVGPNEVYQIVAPTKGDKILETANKILVDKSFNNSASGSRTVTLRRIYQTGGSVSHGIDLQAGANACFLLDGAIRICRVFVPQGASFTLDGVDEDPARNAFFPIAPGQGYDDYASVGNYRGPAGNITLKDLSILGKRSGMDGSLCYSGAKSNNTVQYINCKYKTAQSGDKDTGWRNRNYFACRAQKVIFDRCEFTLMVEKTWPGYYCDDSDEVIIRNGSTITVTENGANANDPANTFYAKIKNSLLIEDATLNLSLRVPDDGITYRERQNAGNLAPLIELRGSANLVLEQHARLKNLVIGGSSTVKAGTNGDGYLLCENITVNETASLEAGGIVVAGFYDGSLQQISGEWRELQTKDEFLNTMAQGKSILDGSGYAGLVVNGGSVTASEYITGDKNGKITVNGGTVTAPAIGTTGKLYGYTMYVPRAGEEYIYTYEKIPEGMQINIKGGTVNVQPASAGATAPTPYLGGMHANVEITGGTVNLSEDAVLGLTDAQQTTLTNHATANGQKPANFGALTIAGGRVEGKVNETAQKGGSIQLPYGTVEVSGPETAVKVYNMTACGGEMTVRGAAGKAYKNPYTGTDRINGQDMLGVHVAGLMSAKDLLITEGSVVYAASAYADVPEGESGFITVTTAAAKRGYLYTRDAYGVIGSGEPTYNDGTNGQPADKNVFGTKVVDVKYVIQPEGVLLAGDVGKVANPNLDAATGLPYYTVVSSNAEQRHYDLKDAECLGYTFLGWYEYDQAAKALKGSRIYQIDKSNASDVYLGAKWAKVEVNFEIQVKVQESECNPDTMELVDPSAPATADGKRLYRFKTRVKIPYGDLILDDTGIVLSRYTTNTLGIKSINYNGVPIGTEQQGQTVANTRVSAEMVRAFLEMEKADPAGDPALVLTVPENSLATLNALITLNLNKNGGLPKDTKFNLNIKGTVQSGDDFSDTVSQYGSITDTLDSITAFADSSQSDGLIHPTAPGYTFGGWYKDKACSDADKVAASTRLGDLSEGNTTTLYAKWTPNTYLVAFSAATVTDAGFTDSRWVTAGDTAPEAGTGTTDAMMNYYWRYDTAPGKSENCFWVMENGVEVYQSTLPTAWREGYIFDCWQFIGEDGGENTVSNEKELSQAVIANLNVDNYVDKPGSAGNTPALTLYAKYKPVTVTYELAGGQWADGTEPSANPTYGYALPGYCKESELVDLDSTAYTKLGEATGADGAAYCVVSTTSGYFSGHNNDYADHDYRGSLSRKGYTFQGWKKAGDTEESPTWYGCTPRFEDLNLTAVWAPNVYNLELHLKDEEYSDHYRSAFAAPPQDVVTIHGVTVGNAILPEGSPSADTWPEKTAWYAHDPGQGADTEKRRLLLGVTFAGLDPGISTVTPPATTPDSVYLGYAAAVTNLLNSKTMFAKGDVFTLPQDVDYQKDLAGATVTKGAPGTFQVPDYPTGSLIPMYGVYRERSLVFIETYVDSNGDTQSKVMYSHPWNTYTDYPYTAYQGDGKGHHEALTKPGSGYALAGWYVGSNTINPAMEYPHNSADFDNSKDSWKTQADDKKNYDINVYTAYVGQQTITQTLTANANPTATEPSAFHTLPGSMQEGALSYTLTNTGTPLNLVSKQKMLDHQYDSQWQEGEKIYTANNTVALELTLEPPASGGSTPGTLGTFELTTGESSLGEQFISRGWKLTLTLYHSKVMTEENSYTFNIEYHFTKKDSGTGATNILGDQWLKDNVTVVLQPSRYTVEYRANLPEAKEKLTLAAANGFEEITGEDTYRKTAEQDYASALLTADQTLTLEGYDRETSWRYGTGAAALELGTLTLEDLTDKTAKAGELRDGKITVYTGYTPKAYSLVKDSTLPAGTWTVTYGSGANDTNPAATLGSEAAEVNYHSLVTFTPAAGDPPPEFVTLTFTDAGGNVTGTTRLDLYEKAKKQEDGSYTFAMPAQKVTIGYSNVMELYLDKGDIKLEPDGFTQTGVHEPKVTWRGNYRILQDENNNAYADGDSQNFHSTANVLWLAGDLTGRTVELGNLNLSSPNSIELEGGCKVTLTQQGKIAAKNILVPNGAVLTVAGAYNAGAAANSKSITLAPGSGAAAIGATQEKPANGSITLKNVDVTMKLTAPSAASGIGPGKQDSTTPYSPVTVADSRITVEETSGVSSQYTGAWIGGAGVTGVDISNTTLLNQNSSNYGAKAVDGNTVTLTGCSIGGQETPVKEPIHAANALKIDGCRIYQQNDYSLGGVSMIGTATSGTTTVKRSTVQVGYGGRGETDKLFTGKLLIDDPESNVTINGTQILEAGHGSIVVNEQSVTQAGKRHTHSDLTLNYLLLAEMTPDAANKPDLTVETLGAGNTITVQQPADTARTMTIGALTIQKDAKLILDGDLLVTGAATVADGQTLTVEDSAHTVAHGVTYRQGLTGGGSYSQTGGRLTGGKDVVVKGNMTLESVAANCAGFNLGSNGGGAAGATTVAIRGGSVTAATIGACGAHNSTFTFVELGGSPTIGGKLVGDHYRLRYEAGELNTANLPTVLRTETVYNTSGIPETVTALDGKPADPTGTDADNFRCWFIWNEAGTERLGLLGNGDTLPGGLKGKTLLAADTASSKMSEAADGTKTLTVYAWLNAAGTATIQSGRLFESFTDESKSVQVSARGAWTAKLESNGTYIAGRDYRVTFSPALPAQTDLTLTLATAAGATCYHYTVPDAAHGTTVNLSAFTKMGTQAGAPPEFAESAAGKEILLLSADFGELAEGIAPTNGTVSFAVLLEDKTPVTLGDAATVSYTVNPITTGQITATGAAVTVQTPPAGDERRSGKPIYLVGTLSKTGEASLKVPLDTAASLTANGSTPISGQWLNGNTVAFALGNYGALTAGTAYTFSQTGLPAGEYSITWRLCTGAAPNLLGGACSDTATGTITAAAAPQPTLSVTLDAADTSRVLAAGTAHPLQFSYATNANTITVTVQKQGILANFDVVTGTAQTVTTTLATDPGPATGTIDVNIPADAGTYRVQFSMAEGSANDNVYYTFIVE